MDKDSKIYVAGHRGMVGSAILRALKREGFCHLLTATREDLNLLDQALVFRWLERYRPEYVFVAAAKVGGIKANNDHPADFIYQNLQIQNNLIQGAYWVGVKKLLFLGSSCIYPRAPKIPTPESELLAGPLEPTNQWYAVAKIAGIKMCQAYRRQYGCDFISAMPCYLYGPGDNYDLEGSHVLPAMIRKFHEAKTRGDGEVILWGTGLPLREFLHVDDLARACLFLMDRYSGQDIINVGSGQEVSIREAAEIVRDAVGFSGTIRWDDTQPDGTPRKLLDSSRIFTMGWKPEVPFEEGIRQTYADFLAGGGR